MDEINSNSNLRVPKTQHTATLTLGLLEHVLALDEVVSVFLIPYFPSLSVELR
jgi:hypothetical protein